MQPNSPEDDRWSPHHYAFAHRALLDVSVHFMSEIFSFFTEGPKAVLNSRLEALLEATDMLIEDGSVRHYTPSDFKITKHSFANLPCLVVEMPPPHEATEAYFVAIVSKIEEEDLMTWGEPNPENPGPGRQKEWTLNYYTLERYSGYVKGRKSLFCEWDSNGRHLNHGGGPEPTLEAFLPFLEDFIAKKSAGEGRPNSE